MLRLKVIIDCSKNFPYIVFRNMLIFINKKFNLKIDLDIIMCRYLKYTLKIMRHRSFLGDFFLKIRGTAIVRLNYSPFCRGK